MSDPFVQDDEPRVFPGESPIDPSRDVPTDAPVPIPVDVPFDPPGDMPPTDDRGGVPMERPPVEPGVRPDPPIVPG
jgi:hypothetical protein